MKNKQVNDRLKHVLSEHVRRLKNKSDVDVYHQSGKIYSNRNSYELF